MNELRAKDYAVSRAPVAPSIPASDQLQRPVNVLGVIWRRKWIILLVIALSVAAAFFWVRSVTPLFTATTTLKLEVYQPGIVDIDSVTAGVTGDIREVRSQLQIIRSRSLMGRVVDALELTKDPEFNYELLPQTGPSLLSITGLLQRIGVLSPPPPREPTPPVEVRERAIDALKARTNVLPVHFSFVFSVSVQTQSPEKSATVANAVAEQYILNQIEVKYDTTEQATAWLSNRVTELKAELEVAEETVERHRADNDLLGEEAIEQLGQRLISLRATLGDVETTRTVASEKLAKLQELIAEGNLSAAAALTGSIRLEDLARSIASNGGPDAAANETALARYKIEIDAVANRLAREVSQSAASLNVLSSQIADLESRQALQGNDIVVLRQLEREAQAASLIYETFLSRLKETSVQQGVHKADAIVISDARVPKSRSFPRARMALAAALLIGLLLSAILVVVLEVLDQTFSSPDALEEFTGLPVVGIVPSAPISSRENVLKFVTEKPTSVFVEAVRNLRTSVQLSGVDGDVKVVALASAGEGEGKTMLSAALAQSCATQQNRKVLLMDCDLRRRRLTQDMGGRGVDGLIAYITDKRAIEDVIHPHEMGGFDIIYADTSPKITADIFASQKFAKLMVEMRERYDMVVIDTPPVLALTDVRLISNYADLILFSISWKRTTRRLIRAALNALALANPKRVAVVFNRTNIAKSIGYYGSYYYND